MKMFVIQAMDILTLLVAFIAVAIGISTGNPIAIAGCALFAVVWSSLWCVLSSIACDVRAMRESSCK